jgi:hypothetical protein
MKLVPLLLFLLAGCTRSPATSIPEAKPDYFQKKKDCAAVLEKTRARVEKQSDENIRLAISTGSSTYNTERIDEVCYAPKLNTCVGFANETEWERVKGRGGRVTGRTFRSVDLLTDQSLGSAWATFENGKEVPTNEEYLFARSQRLKAEIDCAQ